MVSTRQMTGATVEDFIPMQLRASTSTATSTHNVMYVLQKKVLVHIK